MAYVVDRVVICDAFREPGAHYELLPGGSSKRVAMRRRSMRFLASAKDAKGGIVGKEAQLFDELSASAAELNEFVNQLRDEVRAWREAGRPGTAVVTRGLLRLAGLAGVSRRKGVKTTVRDAQARPAPDLVERHFVAARPDQLWVADITYIPTLAGLLFLAVALDVFSRRIVGWAMATHLRTELILDALNMALYQRRPHDVVHHSDQGSPSTPRWLLVHAARKPVCDLR